jgi:hypothetical protein
MDTLLGTRVCPAQRLIPCIPLTTRDDSDASHSIFIISNNGRDDPIAGVSHQIVSNSAGGAYVQWFKDGAFVDAPSGTYATTRRNQYSNPATTTLIWELRRTQRVGDWRALD